MAGIFERLKGILSRKKRDILLAAALAAGLAANWQVWRAVDVAEKRLQRTERIVGQAHTHNRTLQDARRAMDQVHIFLLRADAAEVEGCLAFSHKQSDLAIAKFTSALQTLQMALDNLSVVHIEELEAEWLRMQQESRQDSRLRDLLDTLAPRAEQDYKRMAYERKELEQLIMERSKRITRIIAELHKKP